LFIAFFIVVFFTLAVGLTGFINLNSIKNSSVRSVHYIIILSEIHDYHVMIDDNVYNMLFTGDRGLNQYISQSTMEMADVLLRLMEEYLEIQDQLRGIYSPGELQNMANALELFREAYVPVMHEILDLVAQERQDEALSVYVNRLDPIFYVFSYFVNQSFNINLEYAEARAASNFESASFSEFLMLAVVVMAVVVSAALTLAVTKSIANPLLELEAIASQMVYGYFETDFDNTKISYIQGNDEIAYLGEKIHESLYQLAQVQQLKLETIEAQYQKEKAEAASLAKGDFLARMSHEIRTPMNAIIGMAELALREELQDTAREHVLTIRQAGSNLLSIINDILDFSKIESGKMEIVVSDYMFGSMLNDVVSIIRMKVVDSFIRFVVNVDCNIPGALVGDETRIRQVLLNVLSNAVKYTDEGFVSFTILGEVTDDDVLMLTFEVADSGKGMKPEDLEVLFDDFTQFDQVSNKGVEGSGLGLAITQSLVTAMGGTISVVSEYGKGSTFSVTLPQGIRSDEKLASVENPDEKRVLVYERRDIFADSIICSVDNLGVSCTLVDEDDSFCAEMASGDYQYAFVAFPLYDNVKEICLKSNAQLVLLTGGFGEVIANKNLSILAMPVHSISIASILNGASDGVYGDTGLSTVRFVAPDASVLVVDDISTNLSVAQGLLLAYEMKITLCKSGAEAIQAVESNRFDLVFMDHMMEDMDGIEATARIRTIDPDDPYYADLPVVALTANAIIGAKEMFLQSGFNDFLSKPIETIALNTILEKWIPKEKQQKITAERSQSKQDAAGALEGGFEIEGLDVGKGVARMGGNVENYKRTLAIFMRDGHEKTGEIKKCLETDNLPLYVTYVHALKSAAANVGAGELSDMAGALEAAGGREDRDFIHANSANLLSALNALLTNIETALAEQKQDTDGEGYDRSALTVELTKLAEAISSVNPRAIREAVKGVRPFAQAGDIGRSVEDILQNILTGEYDEAMVIINALLQEGENGTH